MNVNDLISSTTTRLQLTRNGEPIEVFITGYTFDTKEWRKAQREYAPKNRSLNMQVGKKGEQTIVLPNDPQAFENRNKRLASIVTNIEGLDGWEFSPEAVLELFLNDGCQWMVDQWETHLDEGLDFLEPAVTPLTSGSDASLGSPPARIVNG